jgi:hypothetical protein
MKLKKAKARANNKKRTLKKNAQLCDILQGHNTPIVVSGVLLPQTALARNIQRTWYNPDKLLHYGGKCSLDPTGRRGVSVTDVSGEEVIRLFNLVLKEKKNTLLRQAGNTYFQAVKPKMQKTDRGFMAAKHLAFWRKSALRTYISRDFRNKHAQKFVRHTRVIWKIIGSLFEAWKPDLYKVYKEAAQMNFPKDLPPGIEALPFDVWAMLVHNCGYCALICYGDFIGGELIFPELGIALKLQPGDVIFFKSAQLTHCNGPVTGLRRSVVLTTHNNVIYSDEHWVDDGSIVSDDE